MNWQTILTSVVVAAIVTGLIELVKLGNSNKTRYIIQQREKWREDIRVLADEIQLTNYVNIKIPLTRLKTRINPYGEFLECPESIHFDRKMTKKEKKRLRKEECLRERFYLKDGHIHEVIKYLENNENFGNNKELLIKYLSLLMKFDWERSKKESTINYQRIVSLFLMIYALVICVINLYKAPTFSFVNTIVFLSVLALSYFMPNIAIGVNSKSVIIDKATNAAVNRIFILTLIVFAVILIISVSVENSLLTLAMFIMILAFMLSLTNISDNRDFVREYTCAIEKASKCVNHKLNNISK